MYTQSLVLSTCTASEATFVRLGHTVGCRYKKDLLLSEDLDILLYIAMNDGLEAGFWQISWEAVTISFALNSGLSMDRQQYYRFLLRRSEGLQLIFK